MSICTPTIYSGLYLLVYTTGIGSVLWREGGGGQRSCESDAFTHLKKCEVPANSEIATKRSFGRHAMGQPFAEEEGD